MAKPAPTPPLHIVISEGLARAAEMDCGPGRHDYFALLGLSPRQASPEDVKVAVPALIKTLRDVMYDRDLGHEARELKKELQRIGETLATARDIADYRREIEAVPQREQMALLRRFEEEARRAFEEAREPSGGLMETLRLRARDLTLNQPMAEALLNRLWDEFAPVPFDKDQVAAQPQRIENIPIDLSPEGGAGRARDAKGEKRRERNRSSEREEAFPAPQRQSDIRPLAAQLFSKLGAAGKGRMATPPPVEPKSDIDPSNISFGGFPTNIADEAKPLDPGMFDFGFGPPPASGASPGSAPPPAPPSKPRTTPSGLDIPMPGGSLRPPSPPAAAPAAERKPPGPAAPPPAAPAGIPLPVIPPLSPPPAAGAPLPLGQALLGPKPPSSRKFGKSKEAAGAGDKEGEAKRTDGGPNVVTPAWRAAATLDHPAGTSDRRLRRIDTMSWRGYFPVYKHSHKESRALLARAQELAGRPVSATPSMEAAAPTLETAAPTAVMEQPATLSPAQERERAGEAPTMAMDQELIAAAGAGLAEGGPRAVSNKRLRGKGGEAVDLDAADFSGPFAKKPGEGEAWQDHAQTPDYGGAIADIERGFMDAVFRAAGKKGLTAKKRNELVQSANDYGLTMARAIKLIDSRFPTEDHVGDVTHHALKGAVARAAQGELDPVTAPFGGSPGFLPTEPVITTVEVEQSKAAQFFEAFRTQVVPLVRDALFSWPVLVVLACALAYFGLNMVLWLATDSMKQKPPAPPPEAAVVSSQPGEVADPTGAAPPAAAAPTAPDYLGAPLPAGADPRPDALVAVRARFIDGGTYVAAFQMRQCEVTMAEYAEFVAAKDREPPPSWGGPTPPAGTETFPVVDVTLTDARAYCEWRGLRDRLANRRYMIPSERQYRACVRDATPGALPGAVVGARRPNPASVAGGDTIEIDGAPIHHLLGNVSEWTTREIDTSPGLFGASWREALDTKHATVARYTDEVRSPGIGFRYVLISVP